MVTVIIIINIRIFFSLFTRMKNLLFSKTTSPLVFTSLQN